MTAMGQQRSSVFASGMSAPNAEAVVCALKTDVANLRSAIAGKADLDPMGRDFRF
jgi:hypothetical protein